MSREELMLRARGPRRAAALTSRGAGYRPLNPPMSAFLDIGTGAGLASATGVRPYLPPLLAGGLARGDVGIDFDGTDFAFLESTAFLAAVVALGVVGFLVERSRLERHGRGPAELLSGLFG